MESKETVIFDFAFAGFLKNKLFDYGNVRQYPGAGVWTLLSEELKSKGYACITGDEFLSLPDNAYGKAYLLSEMITPFTGDILRRKRVIATCIFSGESPNVATAFYRNLKTYASLYRNSVFFGGCRDIVGQKSAFYPFLWPNHNDRIVYTRGWDERRLLAMIASNKRRLVVDESKPFPWMRKVVKSSILLYLGLTNDAFRYKDLYGERLKAIRFFQRADSFDLYGKGWNDLSHLNGGDKEMIRRINPKEINDKLETLSKYRFSLCFENCVFPGYITEKIFDSFFAGCIPVYYGAPDITDFVPKETFVDLRDFHGYRELLDYLLAFRESDYHNKLNCIESYLESSSFQCFTEGKFIDKMLPTIIES